ncbi:MAG TPA: nucleotidyltransferase domain-containing protein [Acetobacteraceae bacterium]|nr:nucleotidyltransferase domain-containing protein [Acetobacteraceae bacterium]
MDQSAPSRPQDDPILTRVRSALSGIFDDRIERLVLLDSRARGEHRADSDDDVAIFLTDFTDRRQEVRRMVPLVTDIVEETGAVIHPLPFRARAWRERTPLMHEIRLDGVNL